MGRLLSKFDIFEASNQQREKVEIPEWGGYVYVTAVSAADWVSFQDETAKGKDEGGKADASLWMGRVLARTIVDEDSQRLFDDADAEELMKKPLTIINRLFRASDKLNDFTGRGLQNAEKNFEAGAGGDSPTPSLVN